MKFKKYILPQRFLGIAVIISVVTILASFMLLFYFNGSILKQAVKEIAMRNMDQILEQHNNSSYRIRTIVTNQVNNYGTYYNDKDSSYVLLSRIMDQFPNALSAKMVYDKDFFHDGKMFIPLVNRDTLGGSLSKVDMTDSTCIIRPMPNGKMYEPYSIEELFDYISIYYRDSFLSEPHGFNDSELLISYLSPFVNSITGHLDAFLFVDFPLKTWYDDMLSVNRFPNGEIFYVSPDDVAINGLGQMQEAFSNASEMLSEKVHQDVKPMIAEAKTGGLNDFETDDGKWFVYVSKLMDSKFVLFYTCPMTDLWADFASLMVKFFITMIVTVLLIFVLIGFNFYQGFLARRKEKSMEDEIRNAAYIQQSMLPKDQSKNPMLDYQATLIPAKHVGGDLYYYFMRNEYLYFCLGDVSGKGIPASLFMARTISLYCDISQYAISPADIAESLNQELCRNNRLNMFVTAFFGIFNTKTGVLKYCNAGQEEPLYWSGEKSERPAYLKTSFNVPLGIDSTMPFVEGEMKLASGSVFMLYSDGVNEAMNRSREMYGEERLVDFLASQAFSSSESLNAALVDDIGKFARKHAQSDDITIFTLRYKPLHKELVIHNDIKELEKLHGFMAEIQEVVQIAQDQMDIMKVAIDEAMTNVVRYAYNMKGQPISLLAETFDEHLVFTLSDNGKPFNPLEYEPALPDNAAFPNPDDIKIGGLGIPIIKESFDELEYHYENKTNLLILKKSLSYGSEN